MLAQLAAEHVFSHFVPAAAEGVTDLEGLSVTQPGTTATSSSPQQQREGTAEAAAAAPAADGASAAAKQVLLSEADLVLWRLLLLAKLQAAGRQAIGQVALLAASGRLQQDFQVIQRGFVVAGA
jgi:hypothetical protein